MKQSLLNVLFADFSVKRLITDLFRTKPFRSMSDLRPSRLRQKAGPVPDVRSKSTGRSTNQRIRRLDEPLIHNGKDDVENELVESFNGISLNHQNNKLRAINTDMGVTDLSNIRRFGLQSYVHRNVMSWVRNVNTTVGPDRIEKHYQNALKDLLLSKGLSVAKEAQWKFEQYGSSKPVQKRADLIVGIQGEGEKVLFELKVLKGTKFSKGDLEQVIGYSEFFGIPECYLIGFSHDPIVWRLHDNKDNQNRTWSRDEVSVIHREKRLRSTT